jgi:hypothetical protein
MPQPEKTNYHYDIADIDDPQNVKVLIQAADLDSLFSTLTDKSTTTYLSTVQQAVDGGHQVVIRKVAEAT